MDLHLKVFRANAIQLRKKYPESYIITLPTAEKVVALTFDDGPDKSTLSIINILNNYKIRGTFFFVGQLLDEHSKTVLAAIDGGHTVANHSWAHSRPTDFNTGHLMKEILKAQKSIGSFCNAPKLFRPPYGLVNDEQMHEITNAGFKVIAWSVDSMDWYLTNPKDIETCVVAQIHPGAIILMHNRQATINALPHIIETIRKLGYSFVTVDEVLK
jgi:peptidoglycan/xylan/chitin deacetylase (PgdA/CDA1 family)